MKKNRYKKVMSNEDLKALRQKCLEIAATERGNRRKALSMYKYLTAECLRRGI